MAVRRRKLTASAVLAACLGFGCAVVLGALFYGTMVYQLAGETQAAPAPAEGVLALSEGVPGGETQTQEQVGGALCSVTVRSYTLSDGTPARAITASPAAYMERLAAPGVVMQLITGFVIDGMDAVYVLSGDTGILAARSGDTVYMIEASADQQTLYTLGAGARRGATPAEIGE